MVRVKALEDEFSMSGLVQVFNTVPEIVDGRRDYQTSFKI